jgi:hypothetical protein
MKVHYLKIVTSDVDVVCAGYESGCPRFAPGLWALTWASQTSAPQRV